MNNNPFLERIISNFNELDPESPIEELLYWQTMYFDLSNSPLSSDSSTERCLIEALNYVDMKVETTSQKVPLVARINDLASRHVDKVCARLH